MRIPTAVQFLAPQARALTPTNTSSPAPGAQRAEARAGADSVRISAGGLSALLAEQASEAKAEAISEDPIQVELATAEELQAERAEQEQEQSESTVQLSEEEREVVRELAARDREVRAHEEAHAAVAGDLALGGPSYETERGPDGREYAVGGEVQIGLRSGRTPEESIQIARRARRAALAPAEPSGQDRSVAAQASQMEAQAVREQRKESSEAAEFERETERATAEEVGLPLGLEGVADQAAGFGNVANGRGEAGETNSVSKAGGTIRAGDRENPGGSDEARPNGTDAEQVPEAYRELQRERERQYQASQSQVRVPQLADILG